MDHAVQGAPLDLDGRVPVGGRRRSRPSPAAGIATRSIGRASRLASPASTVAERRRGEHPGEQPHRRAGVPAVEVRRRLGEARPTLTLDLKWRIGGTSGSSCSTWNRDPRRAPHRSEPKLRVQVEPRADTGARHAAVERTSREARKASRDGCALGRRGEDQPAMRDRLVAGHARVSPSDVPPGSIADAHARPQASRIGSNDRAARARAGVVGRRRPRR